MRNPKWHRDEIILTLDLYFSADRGSIDDKNRNVQELSKVLNDLPLFPDRPDEVKFRNANGIMLKLANFSAFDPNNKGKGMTGGFKLDKAVSDEFSKNRSKLRAIANEIRFVTANATIPILGDMNWGEKVLVWFFQFNIVFLLWVPRFRFMLNSLYIENYRNLKQLSIEKLGRVNLITGKNNTGKSTILEAIAIYASKGDSTTIYSLLNERGENIKTSEANKNVTESNIRSISSLFHGRNVQFDSDDYIVIGSYNPGLFGQEVNIDDSVKLRFVRFIDEIQRDSSGVATRKRSLITDLIEKEKNFINYKVGVEVSVNNVPYIMALDDGPYRLGFRNFAAIDNYQFVRTRNIDREINGKLWDNITLSEKEQNVIDALKIIEPTTERIAFIEENTRERTAVIKLSNVKSVLPLRSMGDGINRILTIILALVNASNGFLLIDEFENGLHHSVQEKLWDAIFHLADVLNIQIFATTHSEDCINGFENVLNSRNNLKLDGKLIRLDNLNGVIKQVEFNAHELQIATDQNIETR